MDVKKMKKTYKEKFVDYLLNRKIEVLIILFLVVAFVIPLIISAAYSFGESYPVFHTEYEAKDILGFWGSLLSFFGTIALGLVAYTQNDKLKKANDRLLKLEKNRDKPFIKLLFKPSTTIDLEDAIKNCVKLNFEFINIGKGISIDTCFFAPQLIKRQNEIIIHSNDEYDNMVLAVNEVTKLTFVFCDQRLINGSNWLFHLIIHYDDINSIESRQVIEIPIEIRSTEVLYKTILYSTSTLYHDWDDENEDEDEDEDEIF